MSDQKDLYRTEAMRHRERMDIRDESPDAAARNFMSSLPIEKAQIIAAYWPKGREFDTADIIHYLLEAGHQVCLPLIREGTRILDFALWNGEAPLIAGRYGIMQPPEPHQIVEPDIVLVPMLAFDRQGHRLGYGGGYYDATLAYLRENKVIKAVGWAYSQQAVLFNLPASEHDQIMDMVITPHQVYTFCESA